MWQLIYLGCFPENKKEYHKEYRQVFQKNHFIRFMC